MIINESLKCPIQGRPEHIVRALDETERFAREENMDKRATLHLRLLAEELLGMVGTLLQVQNGLYRIEKDEEGINLHLALQTKVGGKVKDLLLSISSDQKNAAYEGVKGKINHFLDLFRENSSVLTLYNAVEMESPFILVTDGTYQWSYNSYRKSLEKEAKSDEWDELEKSVLTKLTRDIIVGVRANSVEIVVKAK